jgi:hypothetical protein
MNRSITWAMLCVAATATPAIAQMQAQQQARPTRPVADPQMVIQDRGMQLEVLPTLRAASRAQDGRTHHSLERATSQETFSKTRVGVVFNHSMHMYGLLTGEISFKLKPNVSIGSLDPSYLPSLTQIVAPDTYVVKAQTPAQFVSLFRALKVNDGLEWIEPYVTYGTVANSPSVR